MIIPVGWLFQSKFFFPLWLFLLVDFFRRSFRSIVIIPVGWLFQKKFPFHCDYSCWWLFQKKFFFPLWLFLLVDFFRRSFRSIVIIPVGWLFQKKFPFHCDYSCWLTFSNFSSLMMISSSIEEMLCRSVTPQADLYRGHLLPSGVVAHVPIIYPPVPTLLLLLLLLRYLYEIFLTGSDGWRLVSSGYLLLLHDIGRRWVPVGSWGPVECL